MPLRGGASEGSSAWRCGHGGWAAAGADEEAPEAAALEAMVLRLRGWAEEEVEESGAGDEEVRARFIDCAAATSVARRGKAGLAGGGCGRCAGAGAQAVWW
jgi:hypothetical protein